MAEYQMTLKHRERIARDTMAFSFDTNGTRYEFRAGQHADFLFLDPPLEQEGDNSRTFSLANSPHDKGLVMIALRMRETGFKTALKTAALGAKFRVSRPRGPFTLHKDVTRQAVFLAGGIGHPSLGRTRTVAAKTIFVLFEPGPGRHGFSRGIGRPGRAKPLLHTHSNPDSAQESWLAL